MIGGATGRIERMVFVTNDHDTFEKHLRTVDGMVRGIRYVAPKPMGPLAGVCFAVIQVKSSIRPECWIFLPDGVVYHGFPPGGLARVDYDGLRKSDPHG